VPTRQKARTTAVVPSGSPHPTPKKSDEPTTMISACSKAMARRPRRTPARIERVEVGVESMRRAMPSRRVSISHTAPLSELRKTNSSSWVLAPLAKRPSARG
jgi:hypothetical protein